MPHHEVYRDGKVHVMSERCSSCIYRPDGVQLRDLRRFQEEANEDGYIPCHQTYQPLQVGNAKPAICRGFWDATERNRSVLLKMAVAAGAITYDDPPTAPYE